MTKEEKLEKLESLKKQASGLKREADYYQLNKKFHFLFL